MGGRGCYGLKKTFKIFFQHFCFCYFFNGQRRVFQLVINKTNSLYSKMETVEYLDDFHIENTSFLTVLNYCAE